MPYFEGFTGLKSSKNLKNEVSPHCHSLKNTFVCVCVWHDTFICKLKLLPNI